MKPFNVYLKFILLGLFYFIGVSTTILFAQTSITSIGTPITQDFSTLPTTGAPGTSSAWINNSTLPNWYAVSGDGTVPTLIYVNNGSQTTNNRLTAFGTTNASDRALGFVPGGNNGDFSLYGWRFKNTMPSTTINGISIQWTLEQWRKINSGAQTLTIFYQVSTNPITQIDKANLVNSGLSQHTPQTNSGASALDGNLGANRSTVTQSISVDIAPGSEIIICWGMSKATSNHHLAIDEVTVTAKADQSITFNALGKKNFGEANFALTASTTSGLPISYTSSDPNVATISGSTITLRGPGKTTITASQAGNNNFNPATNRTQVLDVRPVSPLVSPATNITQTSFSANWTSNNGLNDANVTYTVEYSSDKEFDQPDYFDLISNKSISIPDLTPNTIYYYRIYSAFDDLSSAYTESSAITTGDDYITAANGNWDTPASWQNGINNIANTITIQHAITLNTFRDSVITNKLIITEDGKLTTNQKIHITNELIIEVNADGSKAGQLLNTANIVIGSNAKIIIRKSFAANVWNFMGFPFEVAASNIYSAGTTNPLSWGDFNANNPGDFYVMSYDGQKRDNTGLINNAGEGLNWIDVPAHKFDAKKGYLVATTTSRVIDFTLRATNKQDIFSTGTSSAPLTRYTSNAFAGHRSWNLVTTPFVSSFDLALSSTNAPYYIYNGVNYVTKLSGQSAIVPPFRSFFTQASTTSMNFASTGKRANAPATKDAEVDFDEVNLKLSNGNATYDDLTTIRLQADGTADYVIGQDAAKMFGMNNSVSYIYSNINGYGVAVNTLPRTVSTLALTTRIAAKGTYTLSLDDTENLKNYSAVTLIDNVTGKRTDLLSVGVYSFSATSTGTSNRFRVQLSPKLSTGIGTSDDGSILVISKQNAAVISGLIGVAKLSVYDMSGKMVYTGNVVNEQLIPLREKGLYLFDITSAEKSVQIKSLVR